MIAILVIGLLAAAAAAAEERTHVVKAQTLASTRWVYAVSAGEDRPTARARVPGEITVLTVEEGDRVEAGAVLGRIEEKTLGARIAAAEGQVEEARAELVRARQNEERTAKLLAVGAASEAAGEAARRRLRAAVGGLESAKAERQRLAQRRREGRILAPVSGLVLEVLTTKGAAALPGETIALVSAEPAVLRLFAPERHAAALSRGDRLEVRLGQKRGEAEVLRVYPDIKNGRVRADMQVLGSEAETRFRGRRMAIGLPIGERRALVVPDEFVITRQGLSFVRRMEAGLTLVRTGARLGNEVEILFGLEEGDRLLPPAAPR